MAWAKSLGSVRLGVEGPTQTFFAPRPRRCMDEGMDVVAISTPHPSSDLQVDHRLPACQVQERQRGDHLTIGPALTTFPQTPRAAPPMTSTRTPAPTPSTKAAPTEPSFPSSSSPPRTGTATPCFIIGAPCCWWSCRSNKHLSPLRIRPTRSSSSLGGESGEGFLTNPGFQTETLPTSTVV